MQLSDFDYNLPTDKIAQEPITPRDSSKLAVSYGNNIADRHFTDLIDLLNQGDLLIINNSKVIKSRLKCSHNQKTIEIFLNKPTGSSNSWQCFAKPAKKINIGDQFSFDQHHLTVIDKSEMGQVTVNFNLADNVTVFEFLDQYGITPLPPYIKRDEGDKRNAEDINRYQTVYSDPAGSVAAPTAGLHFTEELLKKLQAKGVQIQYVTLHVGAGTFLPVKTEDLSQHQMHSEFCEISQKTADAVNAAIKNKSRIITVGTTSLRTLESAALRDMPIKAGSFETNLFITPGFEFQVAKGLMTNFHLPKSTPLMLTCAFGGYQNVMSLYKHSLENNYRFCSYGDSCLFLKENNE